MKTLTYFALCAACFAGSYDQAQTGGFTTNGGTISGELIIDSDPTAAGGQYSYPLSFLAGSGTNSIYAFDDRLFLLATGQTLNYSNQIVTIGALAQGITNGFKVGSASFQLDSTGALATNWNAGGNIISNATFIGDGSGLTGISGGSDGSGISGLLADKAFTNDMSEALSVTSTYTIASAVAKLIMRADTTNRPFSKSVIVDVFTGADVSPDNRIARQSFQFEAVDLQTNATAGASEIGIIQAQQIYDDDLLYITDNANTSEYVRVVSSIDNGTWTISYDGAQEAIFSLCVYDGKLYAGQGDGAGDGDVLVYDGSSWSVSYDGAQEAIYSLGVYDGKLYAGQGVGAGDGDVLVYDGSSWSVSYDGSQEYIYSLCVYDGKLYAGQGGGTGDGDIYKYTATGLTTLANPLQYSYSEGATLFRCAEFDSWIGSTNVTLKIRTASETSDYNAISIFKEVQ